jgi:hypothetical protein
MNQQLVQDVKSLKQSLTNIKNQKFDNVNEQMFLYLNDVNMFIREKLEKHIVSSDDKNNLIFNYYLLQSINSYNQGLGKLGNQFTIQKKKLINY